MSLLGKYSTPAERARGARFVDLFESADAVARNGGVIQGAPEIDFSLNCKAAGSVRYDPAVLRLGKSGTVFVRCRVDSLALNVRVFGSDDPLASSGEFRTFSAALTNLQVIMPVSGGTTITLNLASAAAPYAFGQNMTMAATWSFVGGDTEFVGYRDGIQRTTSSLIGGYVETPDNYIAIGDWNGAYLDGEIFEAKFFNEALTDQEIADLHNNTTYQYRNESSLYLPMGMAQHDPDNVRTLDISGNGRHAQFGDGVTPSTYPTKSPRRHGYEFDGSDHMVAQGPGIFGNVAACTIAQEFTPNFGFDSGTGKYLCDGPAGERYGFYKAADSTLAIRLGTTAIASIPGSVYGPHWKKGGYNFIVVSGRPQDTSVWLNGKLILANDNSDWVPKDPSQFFAGIAYTLGGPFDGEVHSLQTWQKALTPMQVEDLRIRLERERWQP